MFILVYSNEYIHINVKLKLIRKTPFNFGQMFLEGEKNTQSIFCCTSKTINQPQQKYFNPIFIGWVGLRHKYWLYVVC